MIFQRSTDAPFPCTNSLDFTPSMVTRILLYLVASLVVLEAHAYHIRIHPVSMAKMTLEDISKTLISSNKHLFEKDVNSSSTATDIELASSDRRDRYNVIPSITNTVDSDSNYLDAVWNWARGVSGNVAKSLLPFPLHTSTYLNGYVYVGRSTDPSDSYDPNIAGDVVMDSSLTSSLSWDIWPNSASIDFYLDFPIDKQNGGCVQTTLKEAAIRFEEATNGCIRFKEAKIKTPTTLRVTANDAEGCFATLGHRSSGSDNVLNLGIGCRNVGTVMHLLGHVLGMAHEDQRPDAEKYIRVVPDSVDVLGMSASANVDPMNTTKYHWAFNSLNTTASRWGTIIQNHPYEYGSLMHNSRFAYSVDIGHEETLTGLTSPQFDDLIGNRGYLTERYVKYFPIETNSTLGMLEF